MNSILAIDPGSAGGLALMVGGGVTTYSMPDTPGDLRDIIRMAIDVSQGDIKAFVEQVGGYMGGGDRSEGNQAPATAMFGFGRGFGQIEGMLLMANVSTVFVRPQAWIKALGMGTKGIVRGEYAGLSDDARKAERKRIGQINNRLKTEWKNKLKSEAQRLFPNCKITLATADACLILEYGRRQENIAEAPRPIQLPGWTPPQPKEQLL